MDFELSWETRTLQETVRDFVNRELIPHEMKVNLHEELDDEFVKPLQEKVKEMGLWLLDVPREFGGAGLNLLEPGAALRRIVA